MIEQGQDLNKREDLARIDVRGEMQLRESTYVHLKGSGHHISKRHLGTSSHTQILDLDGDHLVRTRRMRWGCHIDGDYQMTLSQRMSEIIYNSHSILDR